MAEATAAKLNVEFGVVMDAYDKAISQAKKQARDFGKDAEQAASGGTKKLETASNLAASAISRLGVVAAAYAAIRFGKVATENAAGLERQARAAGLSVEAFQRLQVGFQQQGVGAAESAQGLAKFAEVSNLARLKLGELYESLKFIAPELAKQLSQTKTTEQAMEVYAEAIKRTTTEEGRAALARKAFGEAGTELLPVLEKGAAGIAELIAQTSKIPIVTDQAAEGSRKLTTAFANIWTTMASNFANEFPSEEIAKKLDAIRVYFGGIAESAKASAKPVTEMATAVGRVADNAERLAAAETLRNSVSGFKKPFETTVRDLVPQEKPDYRGVDAVAQSYQALASARGEAAKVIQLETKQQIEAARRLSAELVLSEKDFQTIKANLQASAAAQQVELAKQTQGQLRDLQIAALTAEENGFAALRLEYERDLQTYTDLAKRKLITEQEFQTAREALNRIAAVKIAEENSKLGDKVREQTAGYAGAIEGALGNALTGTFTNAKDAANAFARDLVSGLQRVITQALILKPLMEALTGKSSTSGAVGDAGGGILGSIAKSLGSVFGGTPVATASAEGGGLRAGQPSIINERAGRKGEVFIPQTAGKMVPGERYSGISGNSGGGVSNVYQIDARGADIGVEERVTAALMNLERNRQTPTAALAMQRRKFPLRAA